MISRAGQALLQQYLSAPGNAPQVQPVVPNGVGEISFQGIRQYWWILLIGPAGRLRLQRQWFTSPMSPCWRNYRITVPAPKRIEYKAVRLDRLPGAPSRFPHHIPGSSHSHQLLSASERLQSVTASTAASVRFPQTWPAPASRPSVTGAQRVSGPALRSFPPGHRFPGPAVVILAIQAAGSCGFPISSPGKL